MAPTIQPTHDTGMRRLFVAFVASFGICFIASFIIAIVAHIDGSTWVIYPLGVLVVVPIPVMLVLLYFLIQRALADDTAVRIRGPMDAAVVAAAARSFPTTDRAEALAILAAFGSGPDEPERTRVHLAIIHLSDGSLTRLQYFTDQAKQEYRDVLVWDAETSAASQKESPQT